MSAALCLQSAFAQTLIGEEAALGSVESRLTQQEIAGGYLSLTDIRLAGLKMFATQFRKADGFGDGPIDLVDLVSPGGRPTLQNNGTFLRANGLDAQACLDCHSIVSADAMPAVLGIGGAGGINNSVMFMTRAMDVADASGNGFAGFDGRLINPPALFGTGAVQQLGKEMTSRLQDLKGRALANPGQVVRLRAKGVEFGTIVANESGDIDASNVEGVDPDLVVRPFGRKGEFSSVRAFDLDALMFHMGMQPVELVGEGVDADGDGVVNEVLAGEVSALEIFVTTQETPVQLARGPVERAGLRRFRQIGCVECHRPALRTHSHELSYSFPEIEADPDENVFYSVDLTEGPPALESTSRRGVRVPLFADLKRHDMGDALAESFHGATERQNREFITAKLWGVADTAPYLHDGRALTLNDAIMMHGGEAESARANYAALSNEHKNQLLAFLKTLRNPVSPNGDVVF
ncbi:MAG: hypothetical protein KJO76_09395 [Gammaproteobacteria bacterium]|nr:hypothetical protein [Gammaproteobacteria bacterium]NND36629.1 hypothetical protein [Gammaproteobacteria bacterium]